MSTRRKSVFSKVTSSTSKESLKLIRLERVMDVVYALVIWRLFMILPRPEEGEGGTTTVLDLIINEWDIFVIVLLGLVIVIIFWLQNNSLFGYLKVTDRIHTAIAIFQLFFLLFFLYSIGAGLRLGAGADSRRGGCLAPRHRQEGDRRRRRRSP